MQVAENLQQPRRRPAAPVSADVHPQALLRIGQIIGNGEHAGLLNCGRTQLYKLIKEGRFPRPIKPLGRVSFWRAADVLQAISKLSAGN